MKKRIVLILSLLTIIALSACAFALEYETNLLINGEGESIEGWNDPNGDLWGASAEVTPFSGEYFLWPVKGAIGTEADDESYIYQDVDISAASAGDTVILSAYLANWNQSPNDRATLMLSLLDSSENVLVKDYRMQRDPEWQQHSIFLKVPAGAKTARITLIATRFVGSDNDAYFDKMSFMISKKNYQLVYITGDKEKAMEGEKVHCVADNGVSTNPSDYEWSTSYQSVATVDEDGVVTMLTSEEVGVYAKDKKTGIVGVYWINSDKVTPKKEEKKAKDITVRFDTDGGSPTPASQRLKSGEKVTKPSENPVKEGYTFKTWAIAEGEYDFNQPVERDLIIYARYAKAGESHKKSKRKDIIIDDKDYDKAIISYLEPFFSGYPEGDFKPENTITRAEMATVFARLLDLENKPAVDSPFNDTKGHWAEQNIAKVADYGVLRGYPDGSFKPNKEMKRAEIAALINNYWHIKGFVPDASEAPITDIENHWAKQLITALYNHRFTDLYIDNSFKPDAPLKRADVAQILNRITDRPLLTDSGQLFTDVYSSHWAFNEINTASKRIER